jgi:hypothetical protein
MLASGNRVLITGIPGGTRDRGAQPLREFPVQGRLHRSIRFLDTGAGEVPVRRLHGSAVRLVFDNGCPGPARAFPWATSRFLSRPQPRTPRYFSAVGSWGGARLSGSLGGADAYRGVGWPLGRWARWLR